MTRISRIMRCIGPTALAVWVAVIPMLELPAAAPEPVAPLHAPHACGSACSAPCCSTPPDVCCGVAASGGCESARSSCPQSRSCSRCPVAGEHLVFVGPAPAAPDAPGAAPLEPPPDATPPVNRYQPPTPPPKAV